MRTGYVGIDLAIAKGKRLPVVIATFQGERLVPLPLRGAPLRPPRGAGNVRAIDDDANSVLARKTAHYIATVCGHYDMEPRRIGIDAPSAPRDPGIPRRQAEAAIDRAEISCLTTPTAAEFEPIRSRVRRHLDAGGQQNRLLHANQLWMLAVFALFDALEHLAPCLEVYPQATARMLGVADAHKSRPGAPDAQLAAAAYCTGWPWHAQAQPALSAIGFGSRHDIVDAYLACWVAALDEPERQAFGTAPHDVIWAPRIQHGG